MLIKKTVTPTGNELARSQLMAMSEVLAGAGVKKAVIVYLTDSGNVGLAATDNISVTEMVFGLRQAEHFIFSSDSDDDDEDEDY
jgi:hypothetical protein